MLVAIAAILIYHFAPPMMGDDVHNAPKGMLENYGWFKLTAGTKIVNSHVVAWQDYFVKAKLELPADQFDEFLSSSICRRNSATTLPLNGPAVVSSNDKDFWMKPLAASKSEWFYGERGDVSQRIFADESNASTFVVYIWTATR